jgi:DNA-binding NarL/FixJ family response regulator
MTELTRAVVIEDVPLVRAGISSVLRERHVAVVAEASSAEEAHQLVRGSDAHLLVVGESGGGTALVDAIRRVKERGSVVRVVALVPFGSRESLLEVLDAGADAVVPHDAERHQLIDAIEAARRGERHLAPSLTSILFSTTGAVRATDAVAEAASPLTPRERMIVRLLAEGQTNEEIGGHLFISAATVKTHLSNVYGKLGARNRYDAVAKASLLGLL